MSVLVPEPLIKLKMCIFKKVFLPIVIRSFLCLQKDLFIIKETLMHKCIHGTGNPGVFCQFQNILSHVKRNLFQYQMLVVLYLSFLFL